MEISYFYECSPMVIPCKGKDQPPEYLFSFAICQKGNRRFVAQDPGFRDPSARSSECLAEVLPGRLEPGQDAGPRPAEAGEKASGTISTSKVPGFFVSPTINNGYRSNFSVS